MKYRFNVIIEIHTDEAADIRDLTESLTKHVTEAMDAYREPVTLRDTDHQTTTATAVEVDQAHLIDMLGKG